MSSFVQYLITTIVHTVPCPVRLTLKSYMKKKAIFWGPSFHIQNRMIRYYERYPLLLKWSIAFLRCIWKMGWTFCSIYQPLIYNTVLFLMILTLKLCIKYLIWGTLPVPAHEMGVPCDEVRHPLLLKWFITFLWCISKVWGASDSIYKPLIVHIVSFLLMLILIA